MFGTRSLVFHKFLNKNFKFSFIISINSINCNILLDYTLHKKNDSINMYVVVENTTQKPNYP